MEKIDMLLPMPLSPTEKNYGITELEYLAMGN
jgi:hypothetical protein